MQYGIISALVQNLSTSQTHSSDLTYWTLLLVHQCCLTGKSAQPVSQTVKHREPPSFLFVSIEELHYDLMEHDFIPLLAKMTRSTFGNTNMQKMCLHSLVRLLSSLEYQGLRTIYPEALRVLLKLHYATHIPIYRCC